MVHMDKETMEDNRTDISTLLKDLFSTAQSNGGIEFIYTLVRIDGLTVGVSDPLLQIRSTLQVTAPDLSPNELLSQYYSLASTGDPLALVANLLNCACRRPYDPSPFFHLQKGQFPNVVKPTISEMA